MDANSNHTRPLRDAWLVAGWPGLGGTALIAVSALVRGLGATAAGTFRGTRRGELEHITIRDGLLEPAAVPGGAFFAWRRGGGGRDVLLFVGDSQPSAGMEPLANEVLTEARRLGASRIATFASLGQAIHPRDAVVVRAAATDPDMLGAAIAAGAIALDEGQVGGLNGVLVAAGAAAGIPGMCLLADVPSFAGGAPNPKAALAALRVFLGTAGISADLHELEAESVAMEQQLTELLERIERSSAVSAASEDEDDVEVEPVEDPVRSRAAERARARIEALFAAAQDDPTKATELKRELDRLRVFPEYEDRFLDLFRRGG